MTSRPLEFRVLGPLEVTLGDRAVPIAAPKQRALLAYLLLHSEEPVDVERLVAALWDGPPKTARKIVQVYVSQLRKVLRGDDESEGRAESVLVTESGGYRLHVDPSQVDIHEFRTLVIAGQEALRDNAYGAAAESFRGALALWRGPALADLTDEPFARAAASRLEELRVEAIEESMDAELALGRPGELVSKLKELIADYPLRERLRGQLMLALYRSGQQGAALDVYQDARRLLVDELGIEPGPALQRLQKAILAQDPSLEPPPAPISAPLPTPPDRLIGRERELEQLRTLLRGDDVRLVVLTGPGGIGKTRLALDATTELANEFEHGALLVTLDAIADPGLVASTIARALDLKESGKTSIVETLREHLRDRSLLLLLDSFEHLLPAAPLVADLLASAPDLKVLVTSRAALHLSGEHELAVPPLAIPALGETDPTQLLGVSAVELFVERSRGVKADFELDAENAAAVAAIARQLEGLPLSLELAAAQGKLLPPSALLERLASRLDLLTAGAVDAPARQQSLRATIDWSYRLLDVADQQFFAQLAVFAGGFTLDAAEAVSVRKDVVERLQSLVDKSFLVQIGETQLRFTMLDTLREYAADQLRSNGGQEARRRHGCWYAALAERADGQLGGPDETSWLELLELEHDNLRAALSFAIDSGDAATALQLGASLRRFWDIHGHVSEGRRWLEAALALKADAPSLLRARALGGAGVLAALQADAANARTLFETSIALSRQIGAEARVATELANVGMLELLEGEHDRADTHLEEALALRRKLGSRTAGILDSLGQIALARGDLDRALALLREADSESRALGDAPARGAVLRSLGRVLILRGEEERAAELLAEGLALGQSLAWRQLIAECLDTLAALAVRRHNPASAATLLGCADGAREAIDARPLQAEHRWHDGLTAELKESLGAAEFAVRYAEGRALPTDDAVELATVGAAGSTVA